MSRLAPTPPQTVGPFFHVGLVREGMNVMASEGTEGDRIRIEGRVLDGDAKPVTDAMVELWQADAQGRYRHPAHAEGGVPGGTPRERPPSASGDDSLPGDAAFAGFGRCGTDDDGRYWFETIKPGPVPDPDGDQARHINVAVFARGLLHHLSTRLYFEADPVHQSDPVLRRIPEERRGTVIARRTGGGGPPTYRFDIVLQGPNETVFFDL
jgi:protocatechuate 3,4-dioxygenase alpha subunit